MMAIYRLLRNNKENGPFTIDQLVQMGLKPYDLVWVDGRSAAWRYPGEIEELKSFAPAVEEQPFDRFFKKNVEEPKEETVPVKQTQTISAKETSSEKPVKKQVFVSMPSSADKWQQYQQYQPKTKTESQPQSQPSSQAQTQYQPITIQEEPVLEKKYSQSLDDIKEMYVHTLNQRRDKLARLEAMKKYIKPALLSLLFLFTGATIAVFIMKQTNGKPAVAVNQTPLVPQENTTNDTIANEQTVIPPSSYEDLPNDNSTTTITPSQKDQSANEPVKEKTVAVKDMVTGKTLQVKIPAPQNVPAAAKKDDAVLKTPDEALTYQKRNVEVNAATGERSRTVRNENDEPSATTKNSLTEKKTTANTNAVVSSGIKDFNEKVYVQSNNYIRGAFGGIKDLQLTVTNNSKYTLDEVAVELQYIKPSEQPLKTDIIPFKNIESKNSVTIKIPDSQRGIRVQYRIVSIESKEKNNSLAGF